MIKLFALLPLLALASCGYPSKYEAEAACDEWVEKGGEYIYLRMNPKFSIGMILDLEVGRMTQEEYDKFSEFKREPAKVRYCTFERETRQYLGWDSGHKAGEIEVSDNQRKIIKRFRY